MRQIEKRESRNKDGQYYTPVCNSLSTSGNINSWTISHLGTEFRGLSRGSKHHGVQGNRHCVLDKPTCSKDKGKVMLRPSCSVLHKLSLNYTAGDTTDVVGVHVLELSDHATWTCHDKLETSAHDEIYVTCNVANPHTLADAESLTLAV